MIDYRDRAFNLVEEGLVSYEDMLHMALAYMSNDEVGDMLDSNELSERFLPLEEDEGEFA